MDAAAQIAKLVRAADRIAVLSGAGISTPSGIPDFRSPTGLYSDEKNANVFDIGAFRRDPSGFYRFAREFYPMVARAEPNIAHRVLAKWERAGKDIRIATQNIDDLHQRAGSTHVHSVHGTIETSTCQECGKSVSTKTIAPAVLGGGIPKCACGGVFKPDVTFFGEMLPERAWDRAIEAMSRADLVLIIGTSLVVFPAASLPDYRSPAAELAIVNRDPTHLDHAAAVVTHDDLAAVFQALDALS